MPAALPNSNGKPSSHLRDPTKSSGLIIATSVRRTRTRKIQSPIIFLWADFKKPLDRSVDRFFFVVVLGTLERVRLFSYLHSNGPSKQNIYRPKH